MIQLLVALISIGHVAMEAEGLPLGIWDSVPGAHHVPVLLYLGPVALAALAYGWEGGVLTGLWSAALGTVNVFLWHTGNWEWTLELVLITTVIGMGIAMSMPVEREREQRRRVEAASERLRILNELAATVIAATSPIETADAALEKLVALLHADAAGMCLWRHDEIEPLVVCTSGTGLALPKDLSGPAAPLDWGDLSDGDPTATVIGTRIATKNTVGYLAVATSGSKPPLSDIDDFLATASHQLAVRVENTRLLELERSTMATYVQLVTQAQEEERRRLARDLHDGPAQQLADLVRRLEPVGSIESSRAAGLHLAASETLKSLRQVARDQRPTLLDDLGLVPALDWLVSELQDKVEPDINLQTTGEARRLPSEIEVAFYRVAQEAVNNAIHHSRSTKLEIRLHIEVTSLELVVTDDGVGFEVPESQSGFVLDGGLGVMGMHERADLIGGSLYVQSAPGQGTTVRLGVDLVAE